ncbi:hypothetical protein GGP41_003100 [Bipolaris sorokiniana]|uniref:Uncharacterized protein n=1 Tax=Cochliobolus sativus TaxID=45130 RepID=A0A8H6DT94_COCSA|nr:hypothetical protein GGP41_003100 [Bipolaris sorokiniana]
MACPAADTTLLLHPVSITSTEGFPAPDTCLVRTPNDHESDCIYFLHFTPSLSVPPYKYLSTVPNRHSVVGPAHLRVQCQVNPADANTALQKHLDIAAFTD